MTNIRTQFTLPGGNTYGVAFQADKLMELLPLDIMRAGISLPEHVEAEDAQAYRAAMAAVAFVAQQEHVMKLVKAGWKAPATAKEEAIVDEIMERTMPGGNTTPMSLAEFAQAIAGDWRNHAALLDNTDDARQAVIDNGISPEQARDNEEPRQYSAEFWYQAYNHILTDGALPALVAYCVEYSLLRAADHAPDEIVSAIAGALMTA